MLFKKNKIIFIAELSANHNKKINNAKKLMFYAKKNGADAIKIQTYLPSSITLNSNNKFFKITKGIWRGKSLWQLYNEAQTPLSWHKDLFAYAKRINIPLFSSPFCEFTVDFLESIGCPFYKIASSELTHIPLIQKIASTKKPMIMSTGMASLDEIKIAYKTAQKNGCKDITLLYCVSNYPSKSSDFNMYNIKKMKNIFNCRVGFSDHSKSDLAAHAAVANGATIIEKHICLDSQRKSPDIDFSMRVGYLKSFIKNLNETYHMTKNKMFKTSQSENFSRKYRRSIFVSEDIKKGEFFSKKNLRVVRPANGALPKYFFKLIDRKSPKRLKKNFPLNKSVLSQLKIK
jgi:pseudaminic acid synthase